MGLQEVWFVLIAVLFTGYFVLEGFDFGVGMLMPVLGRGRTETADTRRRVLLNTIGPVWDGNEVWLLTAGGAMFAAFPEWYATLFSGFYLPLLLILLGLIVRVVAIEYRGKIDDPTWRRRCDWGIVFGSWVPAVLWGVAFANIVRGVAIDENKQYIGGFFDLLNPYALLGGATTALVFALHGAVFIALKSADEVREDAVKLAARLAVPAVVVAGAFVVWTQLAYGKTWTWLVVGAAAAALLAVVALTRAEREGWAFVFTTVAIVGTVVLLFGSLFPNVMPSTLGDTLSLTIENASSSPYTLKVMTWAAVIVTPVVLIYQGWTYWVFRQRISTKHIPKSIGLSLGTK
ncbi:cytochrome d ubiquinol oxidase subunit II [Rhodococcus sp. WB1]|uniref:cytochrome d ubiquinol oxidase subunit II n=1 Tax=Rhodococcus TaxID=1827 RepID=UPI00081A3025|nr:MULTISPECIES: cytochrome d ubiquinol oxidase subunit II [unclassified Rhodococcus (in: high G+C Gram-positive bacteria)]ANZ26589.1 cytochrome d ubiquinol oxidase subunit II [Rhodococcus sp. WB1]USC16413.1 cytochrome d ubiquinol oxidase subunit II [Rhodococcus sp. 11-3]